MTNGSIMGARGQARGFAAASALRRLTGSAVVAQKRRRALAARSNPSAIGLVLSPARAVIGPSALSDPHRPGAKRFQECRLEGRREASHEGHAQMVPIPIENDPAMDH